MLLYSQYIYIERVLEEGISLPKVDFVQNWKSCSDYILKI